jgi:hypothetical protein
MKNYKTSLCLFVFFLLGYNAKSQIVFKDVAQIFYSNCASCHHAGGVQFPLTSYSEIKNQTYAISGDISSNRMPPWPPDPNYRHFIREKILSATDKQKILDWISNGSLAGDTTLAPPSPVFTKSQLNGTPDLVIKFPKVTSTSTTTDKYFCINVPNGLTKDRMIRAFEYVPGNTAIIHHAVVTIDTTNKAVDDLSGNCNNFQGQVNIGDYAPGMGPTVFPNKAPAKFGMRLKANSTISLQLHIPEGTAGETDNSEIHFFFYPENETGVREMFFSTLLQNWSFSIPANKVVKSSAYYPTNRTGLPKDLTLYSSFGHSHNTCTSIVNYAVKGTDTLRLLKIPNWDFHWQMQYTYNSLVKVPKGYNMVAEHIFDNTANNPRTPNHNAPVMPGLNTADEMLFDSYIYTSYQTGDENIDIAALLANDPLFNTSSIQESEKTLAQVNVYPNPFSQSTQIEYNLISAQFIQLKIYDLQGKEVNHLLNGIQSRGLHTMTWEGNDNNGNKLAKGTYIYHLQAGNSMIKGKISLE